jgi:hypothetical protein
MIEITAQQIKDNPSKFRNRFKKETGCKLTKIDLDPKSGIIDLIWSNHLISLFPNDKLVINGNKFCSESEAGSNE